MSTTSPFQMLGDPTAAACVGDVCEIPPAAAAPTLQADSEKPDSPRPAPASALLSEHALVSRQLDEDLV